MEPEKKEEKNEDKKPFIERVWSEDIEGKLDEDGFFITPNGSFWDQDYVYFNREGFDKHGGRYDENGEYVPGKGWDDNLNCYESEKDNYDDEKEENEFDEGYTEEAMMKELAQFDDDDLFEGKDLIKEDPNIEKVIKHENEKEEKDDFMDEEKNEKKDNKNNEDDLEDREDDEYEEIEDEEKEDAKDEKNKNKINDKNNVINIEKEKKSFVVKLNDGNTFTINQDNKDNSNNLEIKDDKKENNNKFNMDGIEFEINKIDKKWRNKFNNKNYNDDYYYKDYNKDYKYKNKNNYPKKNNQNKNKKQYKNYNIFDDEKK